jgi:hypothetical protein
MDLAMAAYAARTAVERHAGRLREVVLPTGPVLVQYGKDLRDIDALVLTGGSVINSVAPERIVERVVAKRDPLVLTPEHPRVYVDRHYVLYAAGLLFEADLRDEAAALVASSLEELESHTAAESEEAHAVN